MARRKKKVDVEPGEMDLTSMIDVCFLLIAFFIMVTEVSKAEVVEVFLPQASYAEEDVNPPDDRVIVNITRIGEVWIRGRNFGKPNDPDAKKDIELEFKNYAEGAPFNEETQASELTVLVRADAHVENRYVQCVQTLLVGAKVMKLHYSANNPSGDS
jgi:biopolymer transport protein ExbD